MSTLPLYFSASRFTLDRPMPWRAMRGVRGELGPGGASLAQVEQLYDGLRRMKHDLRGHLANIRGLAERNCYGDMERYMAKMEESIQALEPGMYTGNAVSDVILGDVGRAAARLGIRFQADCSSRPPAWHCPAFHSGSGIILQ